MNIEILETGAWDYNNNSHDEVVNFDSKLADQYLDNLLKTNLINYYLPIDKSMMFKLNTKTMLL